MKYTRLLSSLLLLLLFCGSATAKRYYAKHQTLFKSEFTIKSKRGTILVNSLSDNSMRIRISPLSKMKKEEEMVFTPQTSSPVMQIVINSKNIRISLPKIYAVYNHLSENLTFYDSNNRELLHEVGRTIIPNDGTNEATASIKEIFASPEKEYIYGTGQFQDGFLNIRNLPRRLTQVNTQISIPMIISNRGYGFLWHNYGLTDFNKTTTKISLNAGSVSDKVETVDVTTVNGAEKEKRRSGEFFGDFTLTKAGKYAFMLDVGQKMARKYYVEIDGKKVIDYSNFWLPPTTSWFTSLEKGKHTLRIKGNEKDNPEISYRLCDNQTTWSSPISTGIDYSVFAGNADTVLTALHSLTGGVPLMPKWSMGYIHCRERYKTQDELLENAMEFRKRGLPIDMIVQDWQYWGKHGWNAMCFDEDNYPDPQLMVDSLHHNNIKLMVSVWSGMGRDTELGKIAEKKGYYIPDTRWFDMFNPDARKFYWDNYSKRMAKYGIDAWWQDGTEPQDDDLNGRNIFLGSGDEYRDVYPLLVSKTVYEGLRYDYGDKRVFILSRSAFMGQQRYASSTWSGDVGANWEGFRRQITGGLNYVVTGMPWWTTDTGGFFRPKNQYTDKGFEELFIRWLQFSTFSPLQRVHGFVSQTEPWRYGKDYYKIASEYMNLRYKFLPYIYSNAAEITFGGSSLMRPLVMDCAGDEKALMQKYEYMFGKNILVAPVTEAGKDSIPVYLPNICDWFDFWSEDTHIAGSQIMCKTPINQIPLFIKAGSILPLGESVEYSSQQDGKPLELRIYPGDDASFTLYEDDGVSYDYENGDYSKITFKWNNDSKVFTVLKRVGDFKNMKQQRSFKIVLVSNGKDVKNRVEKSVTYNGEKLSVKL